MAGKNKVLFRFGSSAEYRNLVEKDPNSLYFLLDTNELYRGDVPIGVSHYYSGSAYEEEALETTIARLLNGSIPVLNDILVITGTDGIDDLFIYTANDTWKQLNAAIRSESVLFNDGQTLDQKLEQFQPNLNIEEKALEIDDGVLSVKNYGKQYYAYIPPVPAQGTEGEPDYVPAVAGHYELVNVDEDHPWKDGLTPRTDINGELAWYEPNLSRLDGINDTITSLQELLQGVSQVNEDQTQALNELQGSLETLNGLQAVVGTMADVEQGTPSSGLIKRIEDLEQVGSAGLEIQVNGVTLAPVDGVVNIPLFGENNDGVVPKLKDNVESLELANLRHTYLSALGWNNPFGNMSYKDVDYNTVAEYVDARIEDSTLQWQSIDS